MPGPNFVSDPTFPGFPIRAQSKSFEAQSQESEESTTGSSRSGSGFTVDSPEFVPLYKMRQLDAAPARPWRGPRSGAARKGNGRKKAASYDFRPARGQPAEPAVTTLVVSGVPHQHTPESFKQQLDAWGLLGTYDYCFMPVDAQTGAFMGCAFINFIDPTYASMCQRMLLENEFEGVASPARLQGLEANVAHWKQAPGSDAYQSYGVPPDEDGAYAMLDAKLSPQIREQFHKTKLCLFYKKNRCSQGPSCPFAHSKDEQQPPPDLFKTKLCYDYFRYKCTNPDCRFAHGHAELRATSQVYKTGLCRWWASGGCKAGDACRYAHGLTELRRSENGAEQLDDAAGQQGPTEPRWSESAAGRLGGVEGQSGDARDVALSKDIRPPAAPLSNMHRMAMDDQWAPDDHGMHANEYFDQVTYPGDPRAPPLHGEDPAAAAAAPALPHLAGRAGGPNGIMLRVKGTFMEAVEVGRDSSIKRSLSDGDLSRLLDEDAGAHT